MVRLLIIEIWLLLSVLPTRAAPVFLTSLDQVKSGYYRVYSQAHGVLMALSESDRESINLFCDEPNSSDYKQVWWIRVVSSTETMLYVELQNAVTQRWINRWRGLFNTWPAAMTFSIELTVNGFIIHNDGGLHHREKDHGVVSWSIDSAASKWQIEAVEIDRTELEGQRMEYEDDMPHRNNKPAIIFQTNGGTEVPAIVQDFGTPVTMPANPTRKGYLFMGWSREIPTTMPAENLIIWAKWQEIPTESKPMQEREFESVPEFELAPT